MWEHEKTRPSLSVEKKPFRTPPGGRLQDEKWTLCVVETHSCRLFLGKTPSSSSSSSSLRVYSGITPSRLCSHSE